MPAIIIHSIEMTDEQKKIVADKFISTFSEVVHLYLFRSKRSAQRPYLSFF